MSRIINLENKYYAQNYKPLPVVLCKGRGVYVWDENDKRYMDMMSAYSAVSHGHCHPELLKVLRQQSEKLTIVSRAYYSEYLGRFLEKACLMSGMDKALPMNTGAEAVETAIKAARKWAYKMKGVPAGKAEIIACNGNFHGRTIGIIAMSSDEQYKDGFGPFPAGYHLIPFGDPSALENKINDNTAALIVEPIQGEGGIIVPPAGYLNKCREICSEKNILLICDEVQCGLGRTGKFLACEHEDVKPDGLILGKALGGGLLPVSLFLASEEVMDVFSPGDHGSTFGGNPLAAQVGYKALELIESLKMSENSAELGEYFLRGLCKIKSSIVKEIRGKGLFIGVEVQNKTVTAREICEQLMVLGLLSKDTHETVLRFAPPLTITKDEVEWALEKIDQVLKQY